MRVHVQNKCKSHWEWEMVLWSHFGSICNTRIVPSSIISIVDSWDWVLPCPFLTSPQLSRSPRAKLWEKWVWSPIKELHFSGLTQQVGQRILYGLGGGACSPFSTGGHVLQTLFPKPTDRGGRTHSVSALLLVSYVYLLVSGWWSMCRAIRKTIHLWIQTIQQWKSPILGSKRNLAQFYSKSTACGTENDLQ